MIYVISRKWLGLLIWRCKLDLGKDAPVQCEPQAAARWDPAPRPLKSRAETTGSSAAAPGQSRVQAHRRRLSFSIGRLGCQAFS